MHVCRARGLWRVADLCSFGDVCVSVKVYPVHDGFAHHACSCCTFLERRRYVWYWHVENFPLMVGTIDLLEFTRIGFKPSLVRVGDAWVFWACSIS